MKTLAKITGLSRNATLYTQLCILVLQQLDQRNSRRKGIIFILGNFSEILRFFGATAPKDSERHLVCMFSYGRKVCVLFLYPRIKQLFIAKRLDRVRLMSIMELDAAKYKPKGQT